MSFRPHIPTESLSLEIIPKQNAPFKEIQIFGSSFDGYEHWGSFEECAKIANERRHATITDLRTCLFFEGRRWRHFGESPNEKVEIYWRSLVDTIREKILLGERE